MLDNRALQAGHPGWGAHLQRLAELAKSPKLDAPSRADAAEILQHARTKGFSTSPECLRVASMKLRIRNLEGARV